MKISEILKILKTFNYSINIKRDYVNEEKINFYMPTYRNLHLLHKYIDSITENNKKAFILSGAYGTGKSYLISILLNLLSKDFDKNKTNIFFDKAKKEYSEINKIIEKAEKNKYLIVFAEDSFQDFKQSIIMGIIKTAEENKIRLNLPTVFNIILEKIERWKKEHTDIYEKVLHQIKKEKIDIEKLEKEITNHNVKYIEIFEKIYSEVFAGEKFIPIGSINKLEDILNEFENIVISTGKYNGVIYIFDEFGRYLESNINKLDVKDIQDIAEYCNDESKKSAFIAITHKDIFQYSGKLKSKDLRNEWEKVSGRFNKEHLIYEKQNIDAIIIKILEKNDKYKEFYKQNIEKFREYEKIISVNKLTNGKGIDPETLIENYFPLNYLAIKVLPMLSQKIAQNERTLFSFICSDEKNSLKDILKSKKNDVFFLVSLPEIYDYFETSFKYLEMESMEYKTYLNSKSVINRLDNKKEIDFIKSLSLIYIYNNFNELEPKKEEIIFALNIEERKFEEIANNLIKKEIIIYREHSKRYKIKDEIDINIDNEIKKKVEEIKKIDYVKTLNEILPLDYYYPIKYNLNNKINRYLKKHYIDMQNINLLDKIMKEYESDGKIVYLIDVENKGINIESIIKQYGKDNIFISNTDEKLEIILELREIEAIYKLETERKEFVLNEVIRQEIMAYKDELKNSIKKKLESYFEWSKTIVFIDEKRIETISADIQFMDKITEFFTVEKYKKYSEKIRVGYELINKNSLTYQVRKLRTDILTKIELNPSQFNEGDYFGQPGAENSIARNILKNTGIYSENGIIDFKKSGFNEIYEEIIDKLKEKINIGELYKLYCSSIFSYGMRKGVFSFILALIIIKHKDEIVINTEKDNEEKKFNISMIDQIETNPEKYEISFIKYDKAREEFLNKIIELFKMYVDENRELTKANHAFRAFKNFILGLPKIVMTQEYKETAIGKLLKGLLAQNNPMYFWFVKLHKEYEVSDSDTVFEKFRKDIEMLSEEENKVRETIKEITIKSFKLENGLESFAKWLNSEKNKSNTLYEWVKQKTEKGIEDERRFLIELTEKIQGFDYYNWRSNKDLAEYQEKLNQIVNIESMKGNSNIKEVRIFDKEREVKFGITETETSPIGKVLKSKLIADLKNIGISVSDEEKKKILLELLLENN